MRNIDNGRKLDPRREADPGLVKGLITKVSLDLVPLTSWPAAVGKTGGTSVYSS